MQLSTVRRGPLPIAVLLALSVQALPAQGPAMRDLPVTKLDDLTEAPRPLARSVLRRTGGELDGARMLSATVARELPIRDVLSLLVRDTPFSTAVDASVQGTFSGELRNLTLRQALEAVLLPAGLDYDVQRTVIRVFPNRA